MNSQHFYDIMRLHTASINRLEELIAAQDLIKVKIDEIKVKIDALSDEPESERLDLILDILNREYDRLSNTQTSLNLLSTYIGQLRQALELIQPKIDRLSFEPESQSESESQFHKLRVLREIRDLLVSEGKLVDPDELLSSEDNKLENAIRDSSSRILSEIDKVRKQPIIHQHRGFFSGLLDRLVRLVTLGHIKTDTAAVIDKTSKVVEDGVPAAPTPRK